MLQPKCKGFSLVMCLHFTIVFTIVGGFKGTDYLITGHTVSTDN